MRYRPLSDHTLVLCIAGALALGGCGEQSQVIESTQHEAAGAASAESHLSQKPAASSYTFGAVTSAWSNGDSHREAAPESVPAANGAVQTAQVNNDQARDVVRAPAKLMPINTVITPMKGNAVSRPGDVVGPRAGDIAR